MRDMKDSGFVWLGKIPKSWATKKVKQIFFQKKEKAFTDNPTILSLARDGVKIRDISTNEGQLAADYSTYNPVSKNDLLLNPMDLYSGDNCNISRIEGVISPAYVNLRNISQSDTPDFFNYYFKHQYWSMAFFAHGRGVSFENRWTLTNEVLRNYPVLYPSAMEQQAIADYLDGECARIDGIVTTQRQIIERLKEYKKSVITEAVTRGLNPDVPMKDSGIEWIGDIPAHWKIGKLKQVAKFITGSTPSKTDNNKYYSDNGMLWIKPDNLMEFNFIQETAEYLNDAGVKEVKVVPPYTPLVCCIGSIGKFGWCNKEVAFNQQINAVVFDFSKVLSKYGLYYLCSQEEQHWYFANGNVVKILNSTGQGQITITLPSLSEQQAIADYLDRECARIDTIIEKRERMIELMT